MVDKIRPLTPKEKEKLGKWLRSEMGIDISAYKEDFVARRYIPRANALGFAKVEDYLDSLKKNEKEKRVARKRLLVATTELFRNREVFGSVNRLIALNPFFKPGGRIVALSAPCSTGEEAMSIGISLDKITKDWTVFALDRNLTSLKALKKQKFSKKSFSRLDKNEIKSYLKDEGNMFSFKEEFLEKVVPLCCDLTVPLPVNSAHIVFMRNFFIYMNEKAQRTAVDNVKRILAKGGLLVVGKVERPKLDFEAWEKADIESKIYCLKGGAK